jgi:RimJ/RimL family protein N-acetyltransferase
MKRFVKMAKELGFRAIHTYTFATNIPAIKLFQKHGFVQVGRLPSASNLEGLGYVDVLILYLNITC